MLALACQAEIQAATGKISLIEGYSKHMPPENVEYQNVVLEGVTKCGSHNSFHVRRAVSGDDYDLVVSQLTAVLLTGGQVRLHIECSPSAEFPRPIVVMSTPLSP